MESCNSGKDLLVLVTGGCGYIGSHVVVELLNEGYRVIVVDNLVNSSREVLNRVEIICGKKITAHYECNLLDEEALHRIFEKHKDIVAVMHFAGLKAVGESSKIPLIYYENNIGGTIVLLKTMKRYHVSLLVFSSSATIYGDVEKIPDGGITEAMPTHAVNPYGKSKMFIEEIISDFCRSESDNFHASLLRYFNPVGAHPSGSIGENPLGIPNNLMPFITQVLIGKRDILSVYGNDYPTPDGTGIRDYIHVVDLAKGHLASLSYLINKRPGCVIHNLGTGRGVSVLEMIHAMEKISGKKIPFQFVGRRPGDVAVCYANPKKAYEELLWTAQLDLSKMCEDSWRWQTLNPNGYSSNNS